MFGWRKGLTGSVVVDAHLHLWDPHRACYDWLTDELAPLNRRIGLEEVADDLDAAGVDAVVLVQAADNDEDTELMRATADEHPEVVAIVAYAPLHEGERARGRLDVLATDSRVVGVRNMIHNIPDPDWILRPDVGRGLAELERRGLTFDYVAELPRHLEHVPVLAERYPGLRIVIDHLGKPPIGGGDRQTWCESLARAAALPNVYGKLSGLYPLERDPSRWSIDDLRPLVDHAFTVFGAERLMVGGDWPVSIRAGGYHRVWAAWEALLGERTADDRTLVRGETARSFYRLDQHLLATAAAHSKAARDLPGAASHDTISPPSRKRTA